MANMPQEEEIDLLIASDCISEGQNPRTAIIWSTTTSIGIGAVISAGRIDRLGSINKRIQLVNFWPTRT